MNKDLQYIVVPSAGIEATHCYMKCAVRWVKEVCGLNKTQL